MHSLTYAQNEAGTRMCCSIYTKTDISREIVPQAFALFSTIQACDMAKLLRLGFAAASSSKQFPCAAVHSTASQRLVVIVTAIL